MNLNAIRAKCVYSPSTRRFSFIWNADATLNRCHLRSAYLILPHMPFAGFWFSYYCYCCCFFFAILFFFIILVCLLQCIRCSANCYLLVLYCPLPVCHLLQNTLNRQVIRSNFCFCVNVVRFCSALTISITSFWVHTKAFRYLHTRAAFILLYSNAVRCGVYATRKIFAKESHFPFCIRVHTFILILLNMAVNWKTSNSPNTHTHSRAYTITHVLHMLRACVCMCALFGCCCKMGSDCN